MKEAKKTTSSRRRRQNYFEMNLLPGDHIIFQRLPGEIAHVASKYLLNYQGNDMSMTRLREILGPKLNLKRYLGPILIKRRNDETLCDFDAVYEETYGPKS